MIDSGPKSVKNERVTTDFLADNIVMAVLNLQNGMAETTSRAKTFSDLIRVHRVIRMMPALAGTLQYSLL
jgi:hypothetical protein